MTQNRTKSRPKPILDEKPPEKPTLEGHSTGTFDTGHRGQREEPLCKAVLGVDGHYYTYFTDSCGYVYCKRVDSYEYDDEDYSGEYPEGAESRHARAEDGPQPFGWADVLRGKVPSAVSWSGREEGDTISTRGMSTYERRDFLWNARGFYQENPDEFVDAFRTIVSMALCGVYDRQLDATFILQHLSGFMPFAWPGHKEAVPSKKY